MYQWTNFVTVTLDGVKNAIPGGDYYHYENVPAGVYRFRIDPNSPGVNYAMFDGGYGAGNTAAVFFLNTRTTTTRDPATDMHAYHYGINGVDGLGSAVIHAAPAGGAFSLFLHDWNRGDNSGSVTVIVEQWQQI